MHTVAGGGVIENVLAMPVSQAQDVAHHGHNSGGATVRDPRIVPA